MNGVTGWNPVSNAVTTKYSTPISADPLVALGVVYAGSAVASWSVFGASSSLQVVSGLTMNPAFPFVRVNADATTNVGFVGLTSSLGFTSAPATLTYSSDGLSAILNVPTQSGASFDLLSSSINMLLESTAIYADLTLGLIAPIQGPWGKFSATSYTSTAQGWMNKLLGGATINVQNPNAYIYFPATQKSAFHPSVVGYVAGTATLNGLPWTAAVWAGWMPRADGKNLGNNAYAYSIPYVVVSMTSPVVTSWSGLFTAVGIPTSGTVGGAIQGILSWVPFTSTNLQLYLLTSTVNWNSVPSYMMPPSFVGGVESEFGTTSMGLYVGAQVGWPTTCSASGVGGMICNFILSNPNVFSVSSSPVFSLSVTPPGLTVTAQVGLGTMVLSPKLSMAVAVYVSVKAAVPPEIVAGLAVEFDISTASVNIVVLGVIEFATTPPSMILFAGFQGECVSEMGLITGD